MTNEFKDSSSFENQSLELYEKYLNGKLSSEEADCLYQLITTDVKCSDALLANVQIHFALLEKYKVLHESCEIPFPGQQTVAPETGQQEIDKQLEALLRWEKNVPCLSKRKNDDDLIRKRRLFDYLRWCIIGMLGCCLTFYVVWITVIAMKQSLLSEQNVVKSEPIARVVEILDVVWSDNMPSYFRGQELGTSTLRLQSGIVQLQFNNGTVVHLEGPADFVLQDSLNTFCEYGKISVMIGPKAQGFTIMTPLGAIIDRGTEFFLDVSQDKIALVTVKGLVDLKRGKVVTPVPTGKEISYNGSTIQKPLESLIFHFIDKIKFEKKLVDHNDEYMHRIRERNKEIDDDPSVLVHFDANEWYGSDIPNLARHNQSLCPTLDIVSCKKGEGRLAGGRGVRMSGTKGYGFFQIPGSYSSLTLILSVQINKLRYQSNVFLSDRNYLMKPGSLFWQVSRDGKCYFYITSADKKSEFWSTKQILPQEYCGGWHTLAVTIDRDKRRITHYLDGKQILSSPWMKPVPLVLNDVIIGNVLDSRLQYSERCLDGTIDELLIYQRVLSPKEIKKICQ